MALLERDTQLHFLTGLLDLAREGSGSLVWLAGEAGAGKTSVVHAFAAAVDGDVLKGGCDPLTTPRPLGALYDFADQLDPEVIARLGAGAQPVEVFPLVLDRLRSRLRPVLMVIEDTHWADDATLDLIRFLGRRVDDSNGLIICTYREEEVDSNHPLAEVMGQLATADGIHRCHVGMLSLGAVAELAEDSSVDPRTLHDLTGGNPFFVTEVIAAEGELPANVQDAVLARVNKLDPVLKNVVEAVSVAPGGLELELVTGLVGADLVDVDRALASGVLVAEGASVSLRNELARRAVESSLSPIHRMSLHRALLGLLERGDRTDLARLAHHAEVTADPDAIAKHVIPAADAAGAKGTHRAAVRLYQVALARPDSLTDAEVAGIHMSLGDSLLWVDLPEQSLAHNGLAVDYYRTIGSTQELGEGLTQRALILLEWTEPEECRQAIDEAIQVLEGDGPSSALGHAYHASSQAHFFARQGEPARRDAERTMSVGVELDDPKLKFMARHLMATTEILCGDAARGVEEYQKEVAEALGSGIEFSRVEERNMLAAVAAETRQYAVAMEAIEESTRLASDINEGMVLVCDQAWAAKMAFDQGRYDDAVEHAEEAERIAGTMAGESVIRARGILGRVMVRRGDAEGRSVLEEALQRRPNRPLRTVWPIRSGIAEHAWLSGRSEDVPGLLGPTFEWALEADSQWATGELGFWMWRTGAVDEPPDGAALPYALQMSGDWEASASAWKELDCPYEMALALLDGDESAQLEALGIFDSLGARPAAAMVRARLRDAGMTAIPRGPIRETAADPWMLTPRQREVATLIGRGLDNGAIAEQLFVSKKTVEHHVAAVFSKLGARTRNDVVAAVSGNKK